MGKPLLKDEFQDGSYFLIDSLVVSLTGAKVSQLITSSHFEHSMTCCYVKNITLIRHGIAYCIAGKFGGKLNFAVWWSILQPPN